MAKVLVIGAGGYIGIPLCGQLLKAGHTVTAVDRYYFGRERIATIAHPSLEIVVGDVRAIGPDLFAGCDAVFDLAGLSNDASAEIDPALTQAINSDGGRRVARLAKEAGVRRYVYASSASVYGHGQTTDLTETSECRPQTLYAQSKLRVEEELARLQGPDFETVILRNATVFGLAPRMRFDLAINVMTYRAWKERVIYVMGGGLQWRPFIHVSDVVRALMLGLDQPAATVSGETFNVGGDRLNFQIRQIAQFVLDVIPNTAVHLIPDDPDKRTYNLSFAKIRDRLGFEPTIGIHEGIVEIKQALERSAVAGDDPTAYTLQWYRSLLDWEKRVKELSLDGRIL